MGIQGNDNSPKDEESDDGDGLTYPQTTSEEYQDYLQRTKLAGAICLAIASKHREEGRLTNQKLRMTRLN